MNESELLRRVCETVAGYLAVGNETFDADGARFVRSRAWPRRYDANHVTQMRCETAREIDRLFARADREFSDYDYRRFDADTLTPPQFVARLALEGYQAETTLQLLLEGDLRADVREIDIRPCESDDDWAVYTRLEALDWQESTARQGRPYEPQVIAEFTASKRAKWPEVRYWLAHVDGAARAYCSSWPGIGGVGMIEDLFTHPGYRHRGIATALIARCVADARERGAGPVVIGADPTDTPMRMYAALGFRPELLTAHWSRQIATSV